MTVNKERIQLVIDALRSGEYKQCYYCLKKEDSFCVLGVFTEIYRKKARKGRWLQDDRFAIGEISHACSLFNYIKRWYGISDEISGELSYRNDLGATFPELAIYIENNYLVSSSA